MKSILIVDLDPIAEQGTIGGVELVVVRMAKVLAANGYHVLVLNSIESSEKIILTGCRNIECISLNVTIKTDFRYKILKRLAHSLGCNIPGRCYYNAYSLRILKKFLCSNNFDLIINNRPFHVPLLLGAKKPDVPLIQMMHGAPQRFDAFCHGLWQGVGNSLKQVNAIQVLLPSYENYFRKIYSGDIYVIPNAIMQLPDSELSEINCRTKKIIYAARYADNKQQDVIVTVFKTLAERFPDWEVDFYGTIGRKVYVDNLQKDIKSNRLEKQILFKGYTNNVYSVYKQASICVFPSKNEGFGMSLAEAMTCGIPSIGFKQCSGVNELIEDKVTGFLVDNVEEFTDRLKQLMEDKELRERMGRKAHERAKKYDEEIVWKQWLNLIKRYV
jgi:glycosyltransferase involved in cell wall biosynthesis